MAKGEARWNPKERKVLTNEFPVAPTGDYVLRAKKNWRVDCKQEDGAIPYVWGNVELEGTGTDGGKNVSMLLAFFLTLTPKKENGKPAVDIAGGLTELCQLLNVEPPSELMEETKTFQTETGEVEALNAGKVKEFLMSLGEFRIKAHVKKQNAKPPYPAKNQVSHYLIAEENSVG